MLRLIPCTLGMMISINTVILLLISIVTTTAKTYFLNEVMQDSIISTVQISSPVARRKASSLGPETQLNSQVISP